MTAQELAALARQRLTLIHPARAPDEGPAEHLRNALTILRFSLAHDVSAGGLESAIAEAAAWSNAEAEVELPANSACAGAVLGVSPDQVPGLGWKRLVQIGEVA